MTDPADMTPPRDARTPDLLAENAALKQELARKQVVIDDLCRRVASLTGSRMVVVKR